MKSVYEEKLEINKIFQPILKDLSLDTQTYTKYMYSMLPKTELDLMFIVDCTGSMASWINAVKNEIFSIVKQIKSQFKTSCIRLSFCGYRDIQDGKIRFSIFPFSTDWRSFKKFVSGVSAAGGGDLPEDVFGGLKYALEQNWASGARYAVFIADAPGHGSDYNDCGTGDSFPQGDPSGQDLEHFMKEFAEKKIKFYSARINNSTDKMMKKLSQEYQKHSGSTIEQGELGNSIKDFGKFIVKTALETLNKTQEEEGVQKIDTSKIYYQVVNQMKNNTEFCKSNLNFKQKCDEILELNKSLREGALAEKDEEYEINELELPDIKEESGFNLKGISNKLKRLFSNSKNYSYQEFNATKYNFYIKKEEGYPNLIRWDKPLEIITQTSQEKIQICNQPFSVGRTNYVLSLKDQNNKEKVGRIPIRVKRSEKDNLQYYINSNKDMIIAQTLYNQNNNVVDFCIYEVEINNKKFFLASENKEQNLTKYDSFSNFQPILYDQDGLYKQFLTHDSYQKTLGQYMIANYSHPPNTPSKIYKPLVYSLNPHSIVSHKNQSYIGIFKFFINHTCTEKCTDENQLIDLEEFTDPEKLNFRIPDPIEE